MISKLIETSDDIVKLQENLNRLDRNNNFYKKYVPRDLLAGDNAPYLHLNNRFQNSRWTWWRTKNIPTHLLPWEENSRVFTKHQTNRLFVFWFCFWTDLTSSYIMFHNHFQFCPKIFCSHPIVCFKYFDRCTSRWCMMFFNKVFPESFQLVGLSFARSYLFIKLIQL